MSKTRHIKTRMSQRGINQKLIELTMSFGAIKKKGCVIKYFLSKKNIDHTLKKIDRLRKELLTARDKGGIAMVCDDQNGTEITVYRLPQFIKSYRANT